MKRWRFQSDPDGRGRQPTRRLFRVVVEDLENRAMLSVAQAVVAEAVTTAKTAATTTTPVAKAKAVAPEPSFPEYQISLGTSADSDPAGDDNLFQSGAFVQGYAQPYSTIWLAVGPHGYFNNVVRSDYSGYYLAELPVGHGTTEIRAFAENPYQDYSDVTTLNVTYGNPIVAWDSIALRAIRNANLTNVEAARDLAILHAAQYDAVATIDAPKLAYQVNVSAPKGASDLAAANAAAAWVLGTLFSNQGSAIELAENAAIAGLPSKAATTEGVAIGEEVARLTLSNRSTDRSSQVVAYTPSTINGLWRPTPPNNYPAQDTQYAQVKPFLIQSPSQFRPAAPPALNSTVYDQALQQVATLGGLNSTARTSAQTSEAGFWNDGFGTFTNPGHWNEIAEGVALSHGDSLIKDAKLFAELDFAQADAGIASTDAQYTYNFWRPVSAIDQTNPSFATLQPSPNTPSYVSDVAAYGSAAADILSSIFGAHTSFTDNIYAQTGHPESFTSFNAAADQSATSRIWAGVNFSFDVQAGSTVGDQVGKYVLAHFP